MTRIRLGMVGGGQGAFIGAIHRIAARMDGQFDLVAGALSSDPARATASAAELGLRGYADYAEMARAEAARPDGIEAVAIVTPNHMHAAPAVAFLNAGIHVICDKPLAATPEQAAAIAEAARTSRARFFLTHNYAALPMVREARALVAEGALGQLRLVQAEYLQGWLSEPAEGNKQAEWRTDPARAGAGALGDIGTHAWQLAAFVTGEIPQRISADLSSMVPGRPIDDDARVALRYASGAKGGIWASQVALGQENGLSLRLFGSKAALEWRLSDSERLILTPKDAPPQILTRAQDRSGSFRTPPGHPEGYLEGFANLYTDIARIIRGDDALAARVPGLADGLSGMAFIAAAQASSARDGAWVEVGA